MKKSNLLFLYLMVALYIFPFIIWGVKESTCKNQAYTGIYKEQAFIDIENPQLEPENVHIDTRQSSYFPKEDKIEIQRRTYLYYAGTRQYLPEISIQGDTVKIGKAVEMGKEDDTEQLSLHIHFIDLKAVRLNGKIIWEKNKTLFITSLNHSYNETNHYDSPFYALTCKHIGTTNASNQRDRKERRREFAARVCKYCTADFSRLYFYHRYEQR